MPLNPRADKMKGILHSDWLTEWATWAYLVRSGFPALVPNEQVPSLFGHIINLLLTQLVRLRLGQ